MIKIEYHLSLPETASAIDVVAKTIALRRHCSNRPFNAVGDAREYPKEPVRFAGLVTPLHAYGFPIKMAEEGPEFDIKIMKFPDEHRAPLVWFAEGFIWVPKAVPAAMYVVRYRAVVEMLEEAERIGFSVRMCDEAGFGFEHNISALLSAIERDRTMYDPRESVVR